MHKKVYGEFVERFAKRAKSLRIGNGLDASTEMGPLINEAALNKVAEYVGIGKGEGAKLASGGNRLKDGALGKGFFHEPTIFSDCNAKMRFCQEEIFGPVVGNIPINDFDEALV